MYEFHGRIDRPIFDLSSFETYWSSFWAEIENDTWTYFSVANLQNFDADFLTADFGDGISIRGRDFEELATLLGWGEFELQAMVTDWMGTSGSSYILFVEGRVLKTPKSLFLGNSAEVYARLRQCYWR